MINILIDCANNEVRVDRDSIQYFYAKPFNNMATIVICAWQVAHSLSHEFGETVVQYFGVTPDGRNVNFNIDIAAQAFCILLDNFGGIKDITTSQTNLALQLLIHGAHQQELRNEHNKK